MGLDEVALDGEERMEKAVKVLEQEFHTIRTGRATTGLVENIKVDYYGTATALKQLANISVAEGNLILIRPFDPSSVKDVEKAILKSELGITPSLEGKILRIVFPPLSEERRKNLAHQVKSLGEQAKVAIRNVRKDTNKHIEQAETEPGVSEDDTLRAKEEVQELTKEYEKKVDDLVARKTDEIMQV